MGVAGCGVTMVKVEWLAGGGGGVGVVGVGTSGCRGARGEDSEVLAGVDDRGGVGGEEDCGHGLGESGVGIGGVGCCCGWVEVEEEVGLGGGLGNPLGKGLGDEGTEVGRGGESKAVELGVDQELGTGCFGTLGAAKSWGGTGLSGGWSAWWLVGQRVEAEAGRRWRRGRSRR